MKILRTLLLASVGFAGASAALAQEPVRAVATIKPVYSLLSAITEGTDAETTLLVKGSASPHTYSLSPSDAQALQDANIVFWVGPALEHFMEKPLAALTDNAEVVELEDAPGVTVMAPREGGAFDEHIDDDDDHHDGEDHQEAGDHHDGEVDPHMWLDPENAKAFANAMANSLASLDPENAATYQQNAARLDDRLNQLSADIRAQFAAANAKPYIVFHDAYHYFGNRFGVEASGSVTVNPEAPPSAARIREIQNKIADLGAACVFSEPQFPPKVISVITEGTGSYIGTLDPIGADLKDGPDLYPQLIENLASGLIACFDAQ